MVMGSLNIHCCVIDIPEPSHTKTCTGPEKKILNIIIFSFSDNFEPPEMPRTCTAGNSE